MALAKTQLADIEKLERENNELKRLIGAKIGGRQALLELRRITLEKENTVLRNVLKETS